MGFVGRGFSRDIKAAGKTGLQPLKRRTRNYAIGTKASVSFRTIKAIHQIENRGGVVQVDSREGSPFAIRRQFDLPSWLLSTPLQECFP